MSKHFRYILLGLIAVALLVSGWLFFRSTEHTPEQTIDTSEQTTTKEPLVPPQEETFTLHNVQPVIDTWAAQQSGEFSIVVYDLENDDVIGQHQADRSYFAASIYKLFVAYSGYQAAASGEIDLDEQYINNQTRAECLDAMIRTSDSPCGEKFMAELGAQNITNDLLAYDIEDTSLVQLTTTAQDAADLLIRLHKRQDLPEVLTDAMLDSMEHQIYRDALARGFHEGTFYNKVGFRDYDEYHDVGILALPNGRHYVISMLTDGIGTRNMTTLATSLYATLSTDE